MPTLRNVSKTFTFEDQRIEINEIAQDLYDLIIQEQDDVLLQHFRVDQNAAAGGGSLTYSVEPGTPLDTGVFDYTPPDLSQFLTTETDPVFSASPAASITSNQISNWDATYNLVNSNFTDWNEAYNWGDHGAEGYLKTVYIPTDDTAPSNPVDGTLWWKSNEGRLKIYYEDIDSSQWVDTGINGGGAVFFNDIADVNITAPLLDGQLLLYQQATQTWINTTFATFGGAITWNDIFVGPDGTATGSGGLAYDNTNGEFTYTPPDLGAYWQTDAAKISNWDDAYNWGDHSQAGYWSANTTQMNNWDTAYNWGNHANAGYLTGIGSISIKALADVETWTGTPPDNAVLKFKVSSGFWELATDTTNETDTLDDVTTRGNTTSNSITAGSFIKENNSGGFLKSDGTEDTGTYWVADNTKISNWDTAHGWGDHSQQGYLTSITEADTLATVTGRGSTTTNNITVQNLQATGTVSDAIGNLRDAINALSGGSGTYYNTYVTYLNGQPRWSEQTAANNYQEPVSYATASNTGPGGIDLTPLCDGNGGTYVNMGCGHADVSYLWLSQSQLTDVVKITVGFDGHGWIGFGGVNFDSAAMLRVDNGQAYGANGVTGSPTEIIVYDGTSNNSPAYSGQLEALSFVEYPDVNGQGGTNKGPGSRCHVYNFKIQRLVDNVLTEITYVPPATATRPFTTISTDTSSSHTLQVSDMWNVVKMTSPGGGVNLQLTVPDLSASLSFGDEVRILNGANETIDIDPSATAQFTRGIDGVSGGNPGYSTGNNRKIGGYSLITLTYVGNNMWNIHGSGIA